MSFEVERGPNAQPKSGKAVPYGFLPVVSCICFHCSLSFVLETSAYAVEMAFYSYSFSGMWRISLLSYLNDRCSCIDVLVKYLKLLCRARSLPLAT